MVTSNIGYFVGTDLSAWEEHWRAIGR